MVSPYQSRGKCKSLFISLLIITLALGGNVIVLEDAFGGSVSSETPRAAGEVKSYKIARDLSSIVSLDPTHYYRVPREPILVLLYGSLGDFLADYSVKAGGKSHILTLKPDLKFASGNLITAEDLAFTIKRAIRLSQLPRDHYVQFDLLPQNVEEKIKVLSPTQVQIEVGGNKNPDLFKTILFDGPAGCLLEKNKVEEKGQYAMTPTWLQRNSAGAGPYQLEHFDKGIKVVLRRNPYYKGAFLGQGLSEQERAQGEGAPRALQSETSKLKMNGGAQTDISGDASRSLPAGAGEESVDVILGDVTSEWPLHSWPIKIIFRHFPSIKGREKALQRGWVDQAYQVRPKKGIVKRGLAMKEKEQPGAIGYRWENSYTLTLLLLNQSNPLLANPWVRKAITQAIPYDTLARQFKIPGAFAHSSFLPLGLPLEGEGAQLQAPLIGADYASQKAQQDSMGSRHSFKDLRYNLDEARRTLAKADLAAHQQPLTLTLLATDEKLAKYLQHQLKKIGIQLTLTLVEEEVFFAKLTQHHFDLALMNWGLEYFHPHANAYSCLYNAPEEALFTLASFVQWESPDISHAVRQASEQKSAKKVQQAYKELEKQFLAEAPIIILFQHGTYVGEYKGVSPRA